MPITYGEAKKILSQWAGRGGKCPTADGVDLFVREVLQYLLYSGEHGSLRQFTFNAIKGCFTVPYELEVPIKVKINGYVGTAWDKWFEFSPSRDLEGCLPATNSLYEDPNYYPTVNDIPECGAQVGIVGTAKEETDAHLIVQGLDTSGREVFTNHKGEQISGEYLSIVSGQMRYTTSVFGKITGVTKTKTNGYTPLYWVNPASNLKGFLADYSPVEERPSYRRYRITTPNCGQCVKVTVLGRIRLKNAYADNDVIPFENLYALNLAGQGINASYNNDVATAQAKDTMVQDQITRENEHKRVQDGSPVEFYYPTSAGAIQNIIGNTGQLVGTGVAWGNRRGSGRRI